MRSKRTYVLSLWHESDPSVIGRGECALFEGLSADDRPDYEQCLQRLCVAINSGSPVDDLSEWSSIKFGYESALKDLANGGTGIYFHSPWVEGRSEIPINGLIWMGDFDEMRKRVDEKLKAGFRCIKIKIGGIDFDRELELLDYVRSHSDRHKVQLRLDANGAFSPDNALERLTRLSRYDIHSIEQPIKPGQWTAMRELCRLSPIPIALDEELIGITDTDRKIELLDTIRPDYIILKPSLCGGFSSAAEWIELATQRRVGWWITSALESNIGLNAIAQWTATLGVKMPQGLGTGLLYANNFPSPLRQVGDVLRHEATEVMHTSGSTGRPKPIRLLKSDMEISARATCDFFGIDSGSTLLCPLSPDYIAGRMMQIRAEVSGARLIMEPPSRSPLTRDYGSAIDLIAVVPVQVPALLDNPLAVGIKNMIVGGGQLDVKSECRLRQSGLKAYATYGMTETCSHVALRNITDGDDFYTALPHVRFSADERGCLVIESTTMSFGRLVTNDYAELIDNRRFRWLGRADNAVNSGGLKLHPELIEAKIADMIPEPFFLTGRPSRLWGEELIMVIERTDIDSELLMNKLRQRLQSYELPKAIIGVETIKRTNSGKIIRTY